MSDTSSTVVTASLPERILEKSMFEEGIVAQILVDKYCDHLPLHRQLQRFKRIGLTVAQSTITSLVSRSLNELGAFFETHKKDVLSSGYLHTDETHIKVMPGVNLLMQPKMIPAEPKKHSFVFKNFMKWNA